LKRLALLLVAIAALAIPLVARAQGATPVASPVASPFAPGPEECTVEPITIDRLTQLVGTPVAGVESDDSATASPTPFAMPEGEAADEATAAAIAATVHTYIACLNAGDYPRALALYSDQGLRDLFATAVANGATAQQLLASLGSPQPLPEDQRNLLYGVDDVRVLADGRIATLVIGDNLAEPGPPGPALFYFSQVNGQWLIDSFVSTDEIVTP
jgi:hypothetical protein